VGGIKGDVWVLLPGNHPRAVASEGPSRSMSLPLRFVHIRISDPPSERNCIEADGIDLVDFGSVSRWSFLLHNGPCRELFTPPFLRRWPGYICKYTDKANKRWATEV
jgi:hypothetical protein